MRLINKKSATYRLNFLSKVLLVLFFFSAFLFKVADHHQVFAATCPKLNISYSGTSSYVKDGNNSFTVTASNKDQSNQIITSGLEYKLLAFYPRFGAAFRGDTVATATAINGTIVFSIDESSHPELFKGETTIRITGPNIGPNVATLGTCLVTTYNITPAKVAYIKIYQKRDGKTCYGGFGGGCLEENTTTPIVVESQLINGKNQPISDATVQHRLGSDYKSGTTSNGVLKTEHRSMFAGSYNLQVVFDGKEIEKTKVGIVPSCTDNPLGCKTDSISIVKSEAEQEASPYLICDQIPDTLSEMKEKCKFCVGDSTDSSENRGIWTAIGCIPRDPETIVSVLLRFGLGMGGGVALLMILGSGFMLSISQGDPKQTDTAKQWLGSAIAGLLFIIFSVTILQFIGYNVFQIPGFGG